MADLYNVNWFWDSLYCALYPTLHNFIQIDSKKNIQNNNFTHTFLECFQKQVYNLENQEKYKSFEHPPRCPRQSAAKSEVCDENSILNPPTALKNFKPNNTQYPIMHKIAKIDKFGRISIPVKMREALSLNESTAVYIIDRDDELIIRPMHTKTSNAVKNIAKMNLPVDDWETMEKEIESGAVNE